MGREVEEVSWTAGGEEIVLLGSGDEQKMSWTVGYWLSLEPRCCVHQA